MAAPADAIADGAFGSVRPSTLPGAPSPACLEHAMPEVRRSQLVALIVRHLARRLAAGVLVVMLGLGGAPAQASGWGIPRGDATNSGFADVITSPAIRIRCCIGSTRPVPCSG
jgi:hypothetical protein